MNKPKISIIIPAYKTPENILRRTLNLLTTQTLRDIEIVFVNDGADDIVKNVVKSYADDRIKYFETQTAHGGPSHARNIGLENVTGEYVFFHDHDDYLISKDDVKSVLERMYNDASGADILIFSNKLVFNPVNIYKENFSDRELFELSKFITFCFNISTLWCKLFKTELLKKKNLKFNEKLLSLDDLDFYFKYIFLTTNIKFSQNEYYKHSENKNSLSKAIYENISQYYKEVYVLSFIKQTLENLNLYKHLRIPFIIFCFNFINTIPVTVAYNYPKILELKQEIRTFISEFDITDKDIALIRDKQQFINLLFWM